MLDNKSMVKRISKSESQLILAAILAYPFIWLYQQIGLGGYAVLIFSISGIYVTSKQLKKSRANSGFEADALRALLNRLDPDTARAMNQKYQTTSYRHMQLIRRIQILSDSIHLALNSGKRNTAESRMLLAKENYQEAMTFRDLMSNRLKSEIDQSYRDASMRFPEVMRYNVARSMLDKADTLKTPKAKSRYIQQAISVIEEGLSGEAAGSTRLHSLAVEAHNMTSIN